MRRVVVWLVLVVVFDAMTCVALRAVVQPAAVHANVTVTAMPTCQAVFTPGQTCGRRDVRATIDRRVQDACWTHERARASRKRNLKPTASRASIGFSPP